jgi:hypothetical protein
MHDLSTLKFFPLKIVFYNCTGTADEMTQVFQLQVHCGVNNNHVASVEAAVEGETEKEFLEKKVMIVAASLVTSHALPPKKNLQIKTFFGLKFSINNIQHSPPQLSRYLPQTFLK